MTIEERRDRDRATRRTLITATARRLAEREGWAAVTTRRLSSEIEFSQPVIYKHFASLDALAEAVAIEGFDELAVALAGVRQAASPGGADVIGAAAHAYLSFASENPALYEVMFVRSTRLRFGETPPAALSAAFAELVHVMATLPGERDAELETEVFWSALHGLVALAGSGRLRADHAAARIDLLVQRFVRQ